MSLSATLKRLKYRWLYRWMHSKSGMFVGHSLAPHAERIGILLRETGAISALDYGCGKGKQYHAMRLHEKHHWGLMPTLYDPGVPAYSRLPDGPFDAVICTDVMEHIPESLLDENLRHIFERARNLVYLSISTRPAEKLLPNGENAHCTVRSVDWWMALLERHTTSQRLEASFQGNMDSPAVVRALNPAL